MLLKERRPGRPKILLRLSSIGGQLNAYTSKKYTCIYARTLDENFEQAADILLDMVFNSALRDRDISTEKGVIIEEIGMYEDSPDELIHDIFAQMMWQEHPLGRLYYRNQGNRGIPWNGSSCGIIITAIIYPLIWLFR